MGIALSCRVIAQLWTIGRLARLPGIHNNATHVIDGEMIHFAARPFNTLASGKLAAADGVWNSCGAFSAPGGFDKDFATVLNVKVFKGNGHRVWHPNGLRPAS